MTRSRMGWGTALLIGCLATTVAFGLQNVLRDTWQIRTLPERLMEWLLLFVPLDLFERGLGQLGAQAKEVALTAAQVGMAGVLAGLGTLALRRNLTSWQLLGTGLVVWLATMAGLMPLTGAGFFATGLLLSPVLTGAGYLLVCLGYASALIGARVLLFWRSGRAGRAMLADRRALLVGLVGSLAAGGLARIVGRDGGLVSSTLPVAAAPSPAPTLAAPTSEATPRAVQTAPASGSQTAVAPTAPPTATVEPVPNPPPARPLARDKDGALTAAGRSKGELAPQITANADFYVVTKNAVADPTIEAAGWRLIVAGEVNNPVQVDYRTLRALPAVELTKTLECISNFTAACNLTAFGCDLISTARWRGVRLSDVVALAGGLKPGVLGMAFLSADEFSAGLPPAVVADPETLVVYEMNGQSLPREHGFPARLLVPGRYGMKDPKWLTGIRALNQEYQGWYEQRNWNKDGVVKTMSRIDVPLDGSALAAGEQRLAGIAYAGNRGIRTVEFTTDDGVTWQAATILEPAAERDEMVRWRANFTIAHGQTLTITVRATDGSGEVQTDEFQLPQPDGASGRPAVTVSG